MAVWFLSTCVCVYLYTSLSGSGLVAVMLGGYLGTWPTSAEMLLLLRRLQPRGLHAKGTKDCATLDLSGGKTMLIIFCCYCHY